jgi:Ligand-binding domain of nuclear hormone receptor
MYFGNFFLLRLTNSLCPKFQLPANDRIILLKTACLEIMLFRTAMRFDRVTGSIMFNGSMQLTEQYFTEERGQYDELLRAIYDFAVRLARAFVDETEVALMMAIMLLGGRGTSHVFSTSTSVWAFL